MGKELISFTIFTIAFKKDGRRRPLMQERILVAKNSCKLSSIISNIIKHHELLLLHVNGNYHHHETNLRNNYYHST